MKNFVNVNMVVFDENSAVAVCKPDHLGFMGIFLKNIFLSYPVGTELDIGFIGLEKNEIEKERVPMVVNTTNSEGTGLRLNSFENDIIEKWKSLLVSLPNCVPKIKR